MTLPGSVEILMAAYQGGPFIAAQLDSILGQSADDWRLHVRDDASTDDTFEVARRYAAAHPDLVVATRRGTNSGSACRNFLELLAGSKAPYVMLADDDDVWSSEKIEVTLAEMKRLEAEAGPGVPVLVHTDLTVVDGRMDLISPSMARSQRLAVRETRLGRILMQNAVTGCTVMVNRSLADLVREPFEGVAMHDWWLALLAAAFGRIGYVDVPTVRYRQHGRNAVGAVDARGQRYLLGRAFGGAETRARVRATSAQAAVFLAQFGDRLTAADRATVSACATLANDRWPVRLLTLARYGLWKNTALRKLGQVFYV